MAIRLINSRKLPPLFVLPSLEDIRKKKNGYPIESVRTTPKIRRNEPCPCGSGKKYKLCCFTINKK